MTGPQDEIDAGARRTAILLVSLDQESAARLMARLDKGEQERIAREIVRLENAPSEKGEREQILRDFTVLHLARQVDDTTVGTSHFEFLKRADTSSVVNFIADEHPQVIALILSHLAPVQAGKILESMPVARQQEVIRRLAVMEPTNSQVVQQVEKALESRVAALAGSEIREADGMALVARLLNQVTRATERSILEGLRSEEPELVGKIRRRMVTFEDLLRVNDRGIQNLLKNVDISRLALALKTASPEIHEKISRNLSKRAVERIREEMDLMGPVRVADVQDAQNAVMDEVLRLEEVGDLVVEGRGGAETVVV